MSSEVPGRCGECGGELTPSTWRCMDCGTRHGQRFASLVVGKHAHRVATTAYREAFFWQCEECGWLGTELFSLNAAMKEAGEHWRSTHGTSGLEAPPIVERRDENTHKAPTPSADAQHARGGPLA